MKTLKLADGDLVFERGTLQMIEGPEEIAQCCEIILGTNQGEWFLNPDMGIPFTAFTGKNLSQEQMIEELRAGLAQEPRIQTVEEILITADGKERTLTVSFVATAVDGAIIRKEVAINA
jgi:phage baseplate assembly protein W